MLLITKPQQDRFFREWSGIVSANGWPHDQAETERHALLKRAGFNSLTEVTPVAGFTAVLKELAAMQENLAGMIRADANPRRMLIWNIRKKSPPGYWQSIARDRFATDDLDALNDTQLQQLLYTVSDRAVQEHRPATKTQRRYVARVIRATPDPEARMKFPDLAASPVPDPEFVAGPF